MIAHCTWKGKFRVGAAVSESACLPPMWPGCDCGPASCGMSLSLVFLQVLRFSSLLKNQHFPNSNSFNDIINYLLFIQFSLTFGLKTHQSEGFGLGPLECILKQLVFLP